MMEDKKYYFLRNMLYVLITFCVLITTYYIRERHWKLVVYAIATVIFLLGYFLLNKARKRGE